MTFFFIILQELVTHNKLYGAVCLDADSFYVRLEILHIVWNPEVSCWKEANICLSILSHLSPRHYMFTWRFHLKLFSHT